jgi:predicted nucleic acid-binding protein
VVFIDSNIPMYLVGAAHPHKIDAQRLLEELIVRSEPLAIDAEVLQEILHRYGAIGRAEAVQPAFEALLGVVDQVFSVERRDVEKARDILLGAAGLSARDALHLAVMERYDIHEILSFNAGFDRYPGIRRLRGAG